jgi:hypothetical protein
MKLPSTLADALEGRLNFVLINARSIGHKPRDRPAMARDNDLLATLDTIKQSTEGVLSFESADLVWARAHRLAQSSLNFHQIQLVNTPGQAPTLLLEISSPRI